MRKNKFKLYITVLATAISSTMVHAEPEVTGKLTHESASYTESGTNIGAASAHDKDNFKSETSARIYIDGNLEDERQSTYHIELQAFNDAEGIGDRDGNESYTQRDPLREAYIDTSYEDWLIRLGKQQVVWGTADGMKLLDSINPTDYSELSQNQMEDSRIPVWMVNADKTFEDGKNLQIVVSQPKENIFAGLNRNINTSVRSNGSMVTAPIVSGDPNPNFGSISDTASITLDRGHPFVMKGPDSITGATNGFLNIVPDLGSIASQFGLQFMPSGSTDLGVNADNAFNHQDMNYFTVGIFTGATKLNNLGPDTDENGIPDNFEPSTNVNFVNSMKGAYNQQVDEDGTAAEALAFYSGAQGMQIFVTPFATNLYNSSTSARDSAFEYMDRATFSTFDTFGGATSRYKYSMPENTDTDISLRVKDTLNNGMNYSLNYSYAYDKNPIIDMYWENNSTGAKLKTCYQDVTQQDAVTKTARLRLMDQSSACPTGSTDAADYGSNSTKTATLVFDQKVKRIHNIGGSFDYAIETDSLGPVVIRGEALYQKDTYSPVMDRGYLSIGDLPKALTMRKGDRFKYVLGADITALTNMMVSMQFIQDKNLDHIDSNKDWNGDTCNSSITANCGVYTTDYATMHLTNDFNKAEKDKNFYSLYLSKPYGESGQHRWNNIFIYEENGGKWNRLDTEYTIDDNTVATIEYNKYWGDANTQFGQLEKASNVQVGLKYTF